MLPAQRPVLLLFLLLSLFVVCFSLLPFVALGCYHPQTYQENTITIRIDDVNEDQTKNPAMSYWDANAGYNYTVSLNSIWEATSTDNITLTPVPNSQLASFDFWCIEPKNWDPNYLTGPIYQATPKVFSRFSKFWMTTNITGTLTTPSEAFDAAKPMAKNFEENSMQSTAVVQFNINIEGYSWESSDPSAMLVVQFDIYDNMQQSDVQLHSTGPGTVDFNQGYFAMNKTWATSGLLYGSETGVELKTDPNNNPSSVYIVFYHFRQNVLLDPEFGIGPGPGPAYSPSNTFAMNSNSFSGSHHGPGADMGPWTIVFIVAGVAVGLVVFVAIIGVIIVMRRRGYQSL